MLRVETVGKHMAALKTTTVSRLQEAGIVLTAETVTVIARLCKFVGLTARSPLKQLEHLVNPPRPTASSPRPSHLYHTRRTDHTHQTGDRYNPRLAPPNLPPLPLRMDLPRQHLHPRPLRSLFRPNPRAEPPAPDGFPACCEGWAGRVQYDV